MRVSASGDWLPSTKMQEEVNVKRPNLFWIVALFLGWAFDFLFWKHAPGISFAIYVALCLGGGFLALLWNGVKPSWKSLLLLVPIAFFAVMSAVRREPMSVFLATILPLALMAVLAVTYLGGRWLQYSLSDYIAKLVGLAVSMLSRPIIFLTEQKKQAQAGENAGEPGAGARSGAKRGWAVLRGVLIAIPIIAVFAALLASADVVFASRLKDFLGLFRLKQLPEYLFRLFYISVFAYALMGIFLHAGQKSQDEKLFGMEKPLLPSFLGFTEAAVVLVAVDLLFGFFVLIQFRYFFGGQTNIGVEGYTYAEYARRGFGELVIVAFFSLVLFLSLSAVTKRERPTERRTFSSLSLLLVALLGVMLYSAFRRLTLYEAAYGFTRIRTYTHVFMIWLGILLGVVVILDLLRRGRTFALAALLTSIGFAATLALLNVDGFIVRQNITRAAQGEELDIAYLASLSTDALPDLVSALQDESLPAEMRDAVGAALVCRGRLHGEDDTQADWRSFTFSHLWAAQALVQVEDILDNYTFKDKSWVLETPLGHTYNCWVGWWGE